METLMIILACLAIILATSAISSLVKTFMKSRKIKKKFDEGEFTEEQAEEARDKLRNKTIVGIVTIGLIIAFFVNSSDIERGASRAIGDLYTYLVMDISDKTISMHNATMFAGEAQQRFEKILRKEFPKEYFDVYLNGVEGYDKHKNISHNTFFYNFTLNSPYDGQHICNIVVKMKLDHNQNITYNFDENVIQRALGH